MFEKPKTCAYRKSNIMVVAVATLAFSIGINSTAHAADVYINDYNGLMAINQHIIDGVDDDNEYFLNSNIELPTLDVVAEQARTYIEGIFRGVFDGQGHTLSNLNAPLFDVIGDATYLAYDVNGEQILDDQGNPIETYPGDWSWVPDFAAPGSVRNLGLKTGEAGIIGDASDGYVGVLAGQLGAGSSIDRVGVSGSISTTVGDTAGGLVGLAGYGTEISNSHALVSINSAGQGQVTGVAGGLVGELIYGNIYNSTSTGSVSTTSGYSAMGGLVGVSSNGYIENSSSSGDVTVSGNDTQLFQGAVGGLVGALIDGQIYNSSASGDVTTTGNSINSMGMGMGFFGGATGGLVGLTASAANVFNSSASGDVSSQSSFTGGLIGFAIADDMNGGSISGNSAFGSVTVAIGENFYDTELLDDPLGLNQLTIQNVGGLVGYSSVMISSSSAHGIVHVSSSALSGAEIRYVGGLVGEGYGVSQSIASGSVTAISGDSNVAGIGGLAGVVWISVGNSAASGYVSTTGDGSYGIGGLVGISGTDQFIGEITNSYASGNVLHTGSDSGEIGGLVGTGYGIYDSSATGDVTAIGDDNGNVNALVGFSTLEPQTDIAGVGPTYPPGPTEPEMLEGADLLNYMSETSVWGENPYVNSGRPYILALREFGFYTDKTPKQMMQYVNSNPKFTQADSTILRLCLYLAGDESILITVKDFEALGVTGVNEKNLPVLLKLLKEVDMQTINQKTITENVKIADELLKKMKKKK